MTLNTLYVLLGIVTAAGLVARTVWKLTGAAHALITAITQNTNVTARLARDMASLRKATRRRDQELAARLTALEEAQHGRKTPADPRPANRRPRRPGPHRRRGVGPV